MYIEVDNKNFVDIKCDFQLFVVKESNDCGYICTPIIQVKEKHNQIDKLQNKLYISMDFTFVLIDQ